MKNIEKKELIEVLDGFVKNDRKEDLLQLIENGIVDERMCQSQHYEVREKLATKGYFIDDLIEDEEGYVRYNAYKWLLENNKLEQKYIDYAIQQDDIDVFFLFIKNKIIDERMYQSEWCDVREELAKRGYFIEHLINDRDYQVKYYVYEWLIENHKLEQKHIDYSIQLDNVEILILLIDNKKVNKKMCESKHLKVREELAKNGYFIDDLINDKNEDVRYQVYKWLIKNHKIEEKYIDLAIKNDEFKTLFLFIQNNIVAQRMCQSKHYYIREKLAKNGCFVDKLIKDKNENIRYEVYKWLIENYALKPEHIDYAIRQDLRRENVEKKELLELLNLIIKNDNKEDLLQLIKNGIIDEKMCQSKYYKVREVLVENGYFIDILIKDESEIITYKAYKWLIENHKLEQHHIDYAIQQDNYDILLLLIKSKIIDKRMCQSKWWNVREELAKNGYFLDILINDQDSFVRRLSYDCLIENNKLEQKHIDLAIKNDEFKILFLYIQKNIIDKRMCQSQHLKIREELVKNGYFIDVLINDKNEDIRCQAYKWLIENHKIEPKYIDLAIKNDEFKILFLFIQNNIVDKRMCQSKHLKVREELAKNGYFLDILINDQNSFVRCLSYDCLIENNKLEQKHIDHAIQQNKKIKEFQARNEDNISLLINNKDIFKNNS